MPLRLARFVSRPQTLALVAATALLGLGVTPHARALPMGSQGSWMLMADVSADTRKLSANHALTRNDALGASVGRWEEPPHAGAPATHALRRDFAALTYTRLLHRWNLPHAQANLWFVGSLGGAQARERSGTETLWSATGMADFETTRLYIGGSWELMRAGPLRHDSAAARAGFSFHEAEYDEWQPWFIVEAKRERYAAASKSMLTPMLRFIHKRVFVELGGNRDGAIFNLMLNY